MPIADGATVTAPDLIGASNGANKWQIVDQEYNGREQSNKKGYDIDKDGVDDFFYQKNVVSTDTENEFLVYLGITKRMTWDEILAESDFGVTTSNHYHDKEGILENPDSIKGKPSWISPGKGSGRNYEAVVNLTRGGKVVHTYRGWYHGNTPNCSNGTGFIKLNGLGLALCASTTVDLGAGNGGQLTYTINLDTMINHDIKFNVEDVVMDSVTDKMGDYITYEGVQNCDKGTYDYDEASKTLTWIPASNGVTGTNVKEGNGITGYHYNMHQLVYKVKLDVTKAGFNSCASNMNSRVGDAESFKVNEQADINCHMLDYTGKAELQVPYVRGLLYDIVFKKQNAVTGDGLAGAEFSVYEQDGVTPVMKNGEPYKVISQSDGTVRFDDLAWGTYVFAETKVPDGFISTYKPSSYTVLYTNPETRKLIVRDEKNPTNYRLIDSEIGANGVITNAPKTEIPKDPPKEDIIPEHEKTVKKLDEPDIYELSLDVTGHEIPPSDSDILFIVDRSSSMSGRKDSVNNAIAALKEKVIEEKEKWKGVTKPNIDVAVVEFNSNTTSASDYGYQQTQAADATIASGWTSIENLGYSLSNCSGATNWQAGISEANRLMEQVRNDGRKKYVIFLTDGEPTNRYGRDGEAVSGTYPADGKYVIYGNGSSDPNSNNYDAAVNQWISSPALIGSDAFIIPLAADGSAGKCQSFAEAINGKYSKSALYKDGTDAAKLTASLDDISDVIMEGMDYTNVVIHDKLSENVEFAEGVPTVSVYKITKDKSGNETEELMDKKDYSVNVNHDEKTVDVALLNGENLEDNATYRIRFKVIAKTDTAITALVNGNGIYPDTGDEGTDAKGNSTSSGKQGLWSNAADGAYLDYTIRKEEKKEYYKKPVVQLDVVKHTAVKVWDDAAPGVVHEAVTAVLKAEVNIDEYGSDVDTPRDISSEVFTGALAGVNEQSLGSDNNWTYTWSYLPEYYHYRNADGDYLSAKISYSVSEKTVPDGYTCEVKAEGDVSDPSATISTITNKEITTDIDLKKTDNEGNYLDGASFALEKQTGPDSWEAVKEYEVKNDGTVELTKLVAGNYRLYESIAPSKHAVLADKIYFNISKGIVTLTDSSGNQIDNEQKMWALSTDGTITLTIKNYKAYELPASGSFGIYPFTISGVAVVVTALLLFINNKKKEGTTKN